jgi:hypothetical protein
MWAILDRDNKTVIGVFTPDIPEETRLKEADGRILIEMTLENSPASIGDQYINKKFIRKEI